MDTLQINHALRHWKPCFRGTFAINHLPVAQTLDPPFACVINLDEFPSGGTHWVALYSDELGRLEYFDSAGLPPPHHDNLNRIIDSSLSYNALRLQSSCSSVCGEYCILFLASRMEHVSFNQFIRSFSVNQWVKNDRRVYRIVHHHFDILPRNRAFPAFDEGCVQVSKTLEV